MHELADALLSTPAMSAIFSDAAWLQRLLDAEAALARAQESVGLVPFGTASAIAAQCDAGFYDQAAVAAAGAIAGTPVIPLVRLLVGRVAGPAANYVHFGATSQDIIDTGLMLQARDGVRLLVHQLGELSMACARQIEPHRATPSVARTLGQQAVPMPFGLKAAQWLTAVCHHLEQLRGLSATHFVVQLGGAGGTLAVLGAHGGAVTELFAQVLALGVPDLPWHTRRDGVAEIVCALGVLAGAMSKIAVDLLLLSQTEVAEVGANSTGDKGTSSAMPHKHNPVDATLARAAAAHAIATVPLVLGAMAQEHERAFGGWQVEWTAVPQIFCATSAAVQRVIEMMDGLQVDANRMLANTRLTHGLIESEVITAYLLPALGRTAAHALVADASRAVSAGTGTLQEAVRERLEHHALELVAGLAGACNSESANGSADLYIDRAIGRWRAATGM